MDTSELQRIKQRYNIVGNCDALNHALDVALQVAPTDLSVLIIGESGVGKEIIPRLIHDNSPRKREKYFAINCGSIPEGTIDSELFGHEKGSFTGAIGESEGYFGIANKGTIFLDEVGELPIATQARLLRVLETGEYIRVGGQKIMKTDVRIVAATNVNMHKAVSEGRFREDLYYRLNTIPVQMPPLRDRGEQMSILSQSREVNAAILSRFIPQDQESTELTTTSTPGAHSYESEREILYKILYELRGNVNDLRREVATMRKQIDDQHTLDSFALSRNIPSIQSSATPMPPAHNSTINPYTPDDPHHYSVYQDVEAEEINDGEGANIIDSDSLNLSDISKQVVEKALERNGGNRKKTAQELGISDRTLYRRIKQYGLDK